MDRRRLLTLMGKGVLATGGLLAALRLGLRLGRSGEPPVVVIGSGATGIASALTLLEAGVPVLMLESGPLGLPLDGAPVKEGAPDEPFEVLGDQKFRWFRVRGAGGKMTKWGAHCPRFAPIDLHELGEISPDLVWPFPYDELAAEYPYFERLLGVCGRRDGLEDAPDGEFAGVLRLKDFEVRLAARAPAGVLVTHGRFATTPEANGLKLLQRRLLGQKGFGLLPMAHALSLDLDAENRVSGVTYLDRADHQLQPLRARAVVMAAGTLESAVVLLNSTSARYPTGIGNASGTLGRYLTEHLFTFSQEPCADVDVKVTQSAGAYIPRFNRRAFPNPAGMLGGYQCELLTPKVQDGVALQLHGYSLMLPVATNRIELTGRTTPLGVPIPRVTCRFGPEDLALQARTQAVLGEVFATGLDHAMKARLLEPGASIHVVGTCRMGRDPRASMVDPQGQSHEVKGLWVADGSVFPSLPEKNPTLTMMAMARRTARAVARSLSG